MRKTDYLSVGVCTTHLLRDPAPHPCLHIRPCVAAGLPPNPGYAGGVKPGQASRESSYGFQTSSFKNSFTVTSQGIVYINSICPHTELKPINTHRYTNLHREVCSRFTQYHCSALALEVTLGGTRRGRCSTVLPPLGFSGSLEGKGP